jgi:SAM-dependent methyltransferase
MEPSRADVAPPGVSPRFWSLLLEEDLGGKDVLDVGTGWGRLALALAPRCRRVVGIDRDASLIEEARRRAGALSLANVQFVVADADAADYVDVLGVPPAVIVAHLFLSDALVARSGKALRPGGALAFVGFHVDQWRETGRPSRFAYDESRARALLADHGFHVEYLEVEREVTQFRSVEEGLAAAVGLEDRWKADGRWFRYIKFLEEGGRTLTRSHVIVKARRG